MAGHSRWAQVKHRKAGADARKSARFSKFSRLLTSAAREGGSDPETNQKLRAAIEQARAIGLPKENIERAVARARGPAAEALLTREYEAYGPGGIAYLIQVVTDNSNRTAAELKSILTAHDGKFAPSGSVAWMFQRQAAILLPPPNSDARENVILALIDAGAIDVEETADGLLVHSAPEHVEAITSAAENIGLPAISIHTVIAPKTPARVNASLRAGARSLAEALEDHPDVTVVWTNAASP